MPPHNYSISQPQIVSESFRILLQGARSRGDRVMLAAAKYMLDELSYDPHRFGESRGFSEAANLEIRLAFSPPFRVWFGIHESSRQVFILRIGVG